MSAAQSEPRPRVPAEERDRAYLALLRQLVQECTAEARFQFQQYTNAMWLLRSCSPGEVAHYRDLEEGHLRRYREWQEQAEDWRETIAHSFPDAAPAAEDPVTPARRAEQRERSRTPPPPRRAEG